MDGKTIGLIFSIVSLIVILIIILILFNIQKKTFEITRAALGTCQSNLTAQTDLGTSQTDLGTCQTNLGTCQTNLETSQTNLGTCQTSQTIPFTSIDGYTFRGAGRFGGIHNDDWKKPDYSTFSVQAVRGHDSAASNLPLETINNIELNECATKCNDNVNCKAFNYYYPIKNDPTRKIKYCNLLPTTLQTRTMLENVGFYHKN